MFPLEASYSEDTAGRLAALRYLHNFITVRAARPPRGVRLILRLSGYRFRSEQGIK
jgi:hypothetical protein